MHENTQINFLKMALLGPWSDMALWKTIMKALTYSLLANLVGLFNIISQQCFRSPSLLMHYWAQMHSCVELNRKFRTIGEGISNNQWKMDSYLQFLSRTINGIQWIFSGLHSSKTFFVTDIYEIFLLQRCPHLNPSYSSRTFVTRKRCFEKLLT